MCFVLARWKEHHIFFILVLLHVLLLESKPPIGILTLLPISYSVFFSMIKSTMMSISIFFFVLCYCLILYGTVRILLSLGMLILRYDRFSPLFIKNENYILPSYIHCPYGHHIYTRFFTGLLYVSPRVNSLSVNMYYVYIDGSHSSFSNLSG